MKVKLLLFALTLFTILRLPSLFEPYWYGDEGIYQTIGYALRHGRMLYTGAWDNKPPLLLLLYGAFGGDQFSLRLVSLVFGLGTVVVFIKLAGMFLARKQTIYFAVLFFTLFLATPLIEGNIANTENFMVLPVLVGMYAVLSAKKENLSRFLFAGLMMSIAFLLKVPAVFDILVVVVYLVLTSPLKQIVSFVTGVLLPVILTVVIISLKGLFFPFFQAMIAGNINYVGYKNQVLFPLDLFILKTASLIFILIIIMATKKNLTKKTLFCTLWFLFSFYGIHFSGRWYQHYLLLFIAPAALLAGRIIETKANKTILTTLLIGLFFYLLFTFRVNGNSLSYYVNYLKLLNNNITIDQYRDTFDPITSRNYQIAKYIEDHSTDIDKVFIWGNSGQIYKLSHKLPPGRFSVAYHILMDTNFVTETENAVSDTKPKFIILLPEAGQYPYSLEYYQQYGTVGNAVIYSRLSG